MATSPQGATIAEIFTAAKTALVAGAVAAGVSLPTSKIFTRLSQDANRIKDVAERHATLRVSHPSPDSFGGAGRLSTRVKRFLYVTLFTRIITDQQSRDDKWYLNETNGHYLLEDATINTFHDKFLFSPLPEARRLTQLPLHWMPGLMPAEQPDKEPGYGWSIISFEIDYVQTMTLSDTLRD